MFMVKNAFVGVVVVIVVGGGGDTGSFETGAG